MAEWKPSPHPVAPPMPPTGSMQPVPDLSFPEQGPGDASYLDRLGEIFAGHPFVPPDPRTMPSPLAAFLVNLAGGYGNAQGAQFKAGPRNPATRIALGHLNLQRQAIDAKRQTEDQKNRIQAASQAAQQLRQHQQELKDQAKQERERFQQAQKTPGTPEFEAAQKARLDEKVQTAKALSQFKATSGGQAKGGARPILKQPSPKERQDLTDDMSAIQQANRIKDLFKPNFVGPVNGAARGALANTIGIGLRPGEPEFRAAVAEYGNKIIHALSGAAVTPQEAKRIKGGIPSVNDPPGVFRAKLANTHQSMMRIARDRRAVISGTGIDLSGIPPIPGDEPQTIDGIRVVR